MHWHGRETPVRMLELFMRPALPYLNETHTFKYFDDFTRLENGNISHLISARSTACRQTPLPSGAHRLQEASQQPHEGCRSAHRVSRLENERRETQAHIQHIGQS